MKKDGDDHTAQAYMAEVPITEGGYDNTAQSGSDGDPIKIEGYDHPAQGYIAELPVKRWT